MFRLFIATSLTLLLLACVPAAEKPVDEESPAEQPSEPSTEQAKPITVHARFHYVEQISNPSIGNDKSLEATFQLESDIQRTGSFDTAQYHHENYVNRAQGSVLASGTMDLSDHDVSTHETYQMQGKWPNLAEQSPGRFAIELPEQSDIGEGLRIEFDIKAPVTGTKKATIRSKDQALESTVTHARPLMCIDGEAGSDWCNIHFIIDAIPTTAKTEIGAAMLPHAKEVYLLQGKKTEKGGLIIYGDMLPVYGATTRYQDDHFITNLSVSYNASFDDGSRISQQLDVVVWSTERGSNWQPD